MRRILTYSLVTLCACGDDGANRLPPETVLDDKPPAITNQTHARFTFHAEGIADSFVCEIDGSPTGCIPPLEIDLGEGMHHFGVAAVRKLKPDDTPATYDWQIDTIPPDTAITSGPPAVDNAVTATFVFTSPDPTATFQCALDGGVFVACASPNAITPGDGDHTYQVRAVDLAGNADPTPAQLGWTLDSTAPDTMIVTGPADGSTSGPGVTFTFSSPDAAATFECVTDNGTFAACTSPVTLSLADGGHLFMVRAKDTHGLADPSPAMRAWVVDAIAPPVTIDLGPANPTNDNTPSFLFSSTDPTATFECQIDGVVTFTACSASFDGPAVSDGSHTFRVRATDPVGNQSTATFIWVTDTVAPTATITSGPSGGIATPTATYTFTTAGAPVAVECSLDGAAFAACTSPRTLSGLADGAHTFVVRATDAAGNSGSDSRMFTVDTVPPVVTITSGPPNPTNDSTPTFTFSVIGATTIDCKVDSGAFAACVSPFTTATLADGSHTVTVRGTDAVGNAGTASATFTVDTIPPTVTITGGPTGPTNNAAPTFTFITAGAPTATDCRIDSAAFAACSSPFTSAALPDGPHVFEVRVTDAAGNIGNATRSFLVDTVPPTVTLTGTPNNPSNSASATFTFTVSDGAITCKLDAGSFAACASPKTFTGLADGSHTFVVHATDTAGNVGSATFAWTIDTVPPVVAFTSTPPNPSNTSSATFSFTVSEGSPQCQLDAGPFAACTSPVTRSGLADGGHTFTVRATDLAGNAGSASFTWTIDTTPPVVVIDDAPPAQWPVNYYDMVFHSPEAGVTFTCSLNGAAPTACTSPLAITTSYGAPSTFTVHAADALGNTSTVSTSWTSTAGLVLHYPWEQGLTHDTSLLKQRPAYASDGPTAGVPVVGGWAGTAAGSPPAHIYPKTARALSSSVGGNYTASIWVRANAGGNGGTIWTNATAQNGIKLALAGSVLTMTAFDGGNPFTVTDDAFPIDQWVNVAVRTTGPGKGVQLWINGALFGTAGTPARIGFDAGQASNVTVGALSGVDVDDLRFFNVAFAAQEMCTVVARGLVPPTGGPCVANRPGYELDFEGRVADTGFWGMRVTPPQGFQLVALKLGQALQLTTTAPGFSLVGFANNVASVPEHSFTLWFVAGDVTDTLVDFTRLCSPLGGPTCGAFVKYVPGQLQFFFGTAAVQQMVPIGVAQGAHSIVVAEQKGADGTTTAQMTIFIDGIATKVPIGSGNLYANVADTIQLPHTGGTIVDELEFFPRDLSADPEMLCENGFDGEFDVVGGTCLMTAN